MIRNNRRDRKRCRSKMLRIHCKHTQIWKEQLFSFLTAQTFRWVISYYCLAPFYITNARKETELPFQSNIQVKEALFLTSILSLICMHNRRSKALKQEYRSTDGRWNPMKPLDTIRGTFPLLYSGSLSSAFQHTPAVVDFNLELTLCWNYCLEGGYIISPGWAVTGEIIGKEISVP